VENIATATGNAMTFTSVSLGRALVYTKYENQPSRLIWKNRAGASLGDAAPQGIYHGVRVAADGRRIVVVRYDDEIGHNIWAVEPGGGMTRLTLSAALARGSPVFSPDGMSIAFAQPGQRAITLFTIPFDGRYLLYREASPTTQQDLWVLPLQPGARAFPIINTPSREAYGRISPDSRWIAYVSDQSGVFEIYVQSFAALVAGAQTSARWTVSTEGGSEPVWRPDGKELLYRVPGGAVFSSGIDASGDTFHATPPKLVFDAPPGLSTAHTIAYYPSSFGVSRDSDRFIMIEPVTKLGSSPVHVITDWHAATAN
jgi:Tol biopolymer transport system component